jgi:hypothetical protein
MAVNLEASFGVFNFPQLIGDSLNGTGMSVVRSVNGVDFSFTDYTVTAIIYDRTGAIATTASVAKQTVTVADDTLFITAPPADMPTNAGTFNYRVQATSNNNPDEVFTVLAGTIVNMKLKEV